MSTEPSLHPSRAAIDYAMRKQFQTRIFHQSLLQSTSKDPEGQPAVAVLTASASVCPAAGQYERVSTAAARALLRVPGRALGFADVRLVRSALYYALLLGSFVLEPLGRWQVSSCAGSWLLLSLTPLCTC